MGNLMCTVQLFATDPMFRASYQAKPDSALAQRGLSLSGVEFRALDRAWQVLATWLESEELPPIDDPNQPPWW